MLSEPVLQLVKRINEFILNPLIMLLFAVALVIFLWGVFEFVRDAASEDGRTKGRDHIIYGLIGMAIMVSVYGIIAVITNTFGIPSNISPFL